MKSCPFRLLVLLRAALALSHAATSHSSLRHSVIRATERGQDSRTALSTWRSPRGGVAEAVQRLEAVEDQRTSRVLCRVRDETGISTTVRLQPKTNTRSLVFNDDVMGVETRVRCGGKVADECLMAQATTVHSADECPPCSCESNMGELYGNYALAMAEEVDSRCTRGIRTEPKTLADDGTGPLRMLLLGLGGGELATHIVKECNSAGTDVAIQAVELDRRLPVLASKYFGLPASVGVTVGDAGPVAMALATDVNRGSILADQQQFDVILVDCFSSGGVTPEHCRSHEFVVALKALIRDGGTVIQHLWHVDQNHAEVADEFAATVDLYNSVFKGDGCKASVTRLEGPDSLVRASCSVDAAADKS